MNLALFDFDGTLTNRDSYTSFVRLAVRQWRRLAGWPLVGPVVFAYRRGLVSATATRRVVSRMGFCGEPVSRLQELGRAYAREVLPQTVRPTAWSRLEWHRRQGDEVVIVSASLDVYMQPWCAANGLHCICTELETRNGKHTGRYLHGDCSGAEKARRIRERFDLQAYSLIYAYGDTDEDREMLELADVSFFGGREGRNLAGCR